MTLGILIIDLIRFILGNAAVDVGIGIDINAGNHRVRLDAVIVNFLLRSML